MRKAKDMTRGEFLGLLDRAGMAGGPTFGAIVGEMGRQRVSVWTVVVALTAPWMPQLIAWACE